MELKISNEEELKRFSEHLTPDLNQNIFFSGVFGVGKTYFINEFFKQEKEEYTSVKLYPVNYSVSNNEDIFEYIKFDIAFELLKLNPDFSKLEEAEKTNVFSAFYSKRHFKEMVKILLKNLSKIDHRVEAIYSTIESLQNYINEVKQEYDRDKKDELTEFLEEFTDKPGTIYEQNHFTDLINGLIQTLKIGGKKLVLVIDDLDRIDPEHIFRILNVFSVHNDYFNTKEHKFGFDKVILIGDVDNIRNIFHARYGTNTNFSGYIDKFYSTSIFAFDNRTQLKKKILEIFGKMDLPDPIAESLLVESNTPSQNFIKIILEMISSSSLTIRSFENLSKNKFSNIFKMHFGQFTNLNLEETPIIAMMVLLKRLSGGHKELVDNLKKTKIKTPQDDLKSYDENILWLYGNLAMVLDYRNNRFKVNSHKTYEYENKDYGFKIEYKLSKFDYGVYAQAVKIDFLRPETPFSGDTDKSKVGIQISSMPKYDLLIEAAEIIDSVS